MLAYLEKIPLPSLTDDQVALVQAPLTIQELKLATGSLSGNNAQGLNGLQSEVFYIYGNDLLPFLFKVFHFGLDIGNMLVSMGEALFTLILKLQCILSVQFPYHT